jgi:hypothetical protein
VSIAPLQFTHAIDLPRSLKAPIRMGSFDSPEDHPCKTKLQSRSLQSPGRYKPKRCCDNENAGNEQSAVSKIESGAIAKNDKKISSGYSRANINRETASFQLDECDSNFERD